MLLRVLLGVMLLWAGVAHAGMTVEVAAGKLVVRVEAAKVAAWRPSRDGLVVLAEGNGSADVQDLGEGWKAEKLAENGLYGVYLRGQGQGWGVLQEGGKWLIREGAVAPKEGSAVLLKDGWRVDGFAVSRKDVRVAGEAWQVAAVDKPVSVMGSVLGVVRKSGQVAAMADEKGAEKAVAVKEVVTPDVAKVAMRVSRTDEGGKAVSAAVVGGGKVVGSVSATPALVVLKKASVASGTAMMPVSVEQMLRRLEPAAGNAHAAVRPVMAAPAGVAAAVVEPVAAAAPAGQPVVLEGGEGKVPVFSAEGLQALPSPGAGSELVAKSYMAESVAGIYTPGMVVSVTVPAEVLERVSSSAMPMVQVDEATLVAQGNAEISDTVGGVEADKLFPAKGESYSESWEDYNRAIADAPTSAAERSARREMMAFYLLWDRPEEALALAQLMPLREDGAPADALSRFYAGLAQVAMRRPVDGRFFDQEGPLARHAELWKAVAAAQAEDYGNALKMWPKERGILPVYPGYLRQVAQTAQATSLVMAGDRDVARKVVDALLEQYSAEEQPPALWRLKGLALLGTPEAREGLDYLAKAAENVHDKETAYRAKYEFVEALRQRREISDDQVKTYLNELWMDWRGDSLERDVLTTLADLYERQGEAREALESWQILVRAFPDLPDMGTVTDRMSQAFVNIFDPENPKTYDALTYLGLYYDFKELTPNDERGDRVVEQVAKLLTDATLWKRAEPLLEQQIMYRPLEPLAQVRMVLMLSEVYRRQGRAADALKLLDKWQKVAADTNSQRLWKMAEAQALMDLVRYDSAKRAVAPVSDSREGLRMAMQADWKAKNWNAVVGELQKLLAEVAADELADNPEAQLDVFKLAFAYGQLKDMAGLKVLRERYARAFEKLPQLADNVNAVAASSGVDGISSGGSFAPLTTALSDVNGLNQKIKGLRVQHERQRKEREEYNNRMRYMELLPPPVI